jgi:mannose-6-phosphate isomerase-like protein (cupin superfamily)
LIINVQLSTIVLPVHSKERPLFARNRSEAPWRERAGLVSRILLHGRDLPETRLTVTWVEVAPEVGQRPHSHAPEQVYVIARGRGEMNVGGEEWESIGKRSTTRVR